MRTVLATLAVLLVAGCARPTERVRVAPAVAVVATEPATPVGNPLVGGIVMPPGRTVAADIAAAPTLAMLSRAVQSAGLIDMLGGPGPLTMFAPTDEAWGRLAPGTVEALMKPDNHVALIKLLDLHLVAGRLTSAELVRRVQADGGRATLTTVAGEPLVVTMTGNILTLTDSGGDKSYLEAADVRATNGVMHVVNGVLVPRLN